MTPLKFAIAGVLLATVPVGAATAEPTSALDRPAYGCLKVTAPSIAIKEKSVGTSTTLATASKGEILIKRHRFCTFGSCAVTTRGDVKGFAEKALLVVAACPSPKKKKS